MSQPYMSQPFPSPPKSIAANVIAEMQREAVAELKTVSDAIKVCGDGSDLRLLQDERAFYQGKLLVLNELVRISES